MRNHPQLSAKTHIGKMKSTIIFILSLLFVLEKQAAGVAFQGQTKSQLPDRSYEYLLTQQKTHQHVGQKGAKGISSEESFLTQTKSQMQGSDLSMQQTQTKQAYVAKKQASLCQAGGLSQQKSAQLIATKHAGGQTQVHKQFDMTQAKGRSGQYIKTKGSSLYLGAKGASQLKGTSQYMKTKGSSLYQGTKGTKFQERQVSFKGQSQYPSDEQMQQQFVKGAQIKYQDSMEQYLQ
ncbi:seminal vesicle secretory protein 2-like [Dipodomys spectabilis]|uniref:seminal vesicle secretory protein 2-like n=1 Tax=Dipodomys spectabilis TaxID=105255 RepID=UPI001C53B1B6|nr:seminal vesicle secretory protein 2-like [Dipodomys spectabilis]